MKTINTTEKINSSTAVLKAVLLLLLCLSSGAAVVVCAQRAGNLDTTFAANGKQVIVLQNFADQGRSVATDADRRTYAAGRAAINGLQTNFMFARFNQTGALEQNVNFNFGIRAGFSASIDQANTILVQSDGAVTIIGQTEINGSRFKTDFAVARRCAACADFTTAQIDFRVSDNFDSIDIANAAAFSPTGKLFIVGRSTNAEVAGGQNFAVAIYNENGVLETKFTTDLGGAEEARAVAAQPDGKFVVAGTSNNTSGVPGDFMIVRYNADGSLDTTFDGDGKVTIDFNNSQDTASALVIQPDGKIVVAGALYIPPPDRTIPAVGDFALARLNTDGSLDASFDGDGKLTTDFGTTADAASSLSLQADGKIVAVGTAAARYNADGSLDLSFDGDGKSTQIAGNAATVQNDNKITTVGATAVNAVTNTDLLASRFAADGSIDASFDQDGSATASSRINSAARKTLLDPDGKIVVVGNYGRFSFVTRLNADGSRDAAFTDYFPTNIQIINAIIRLSDGKYLLGGYNYQSVNSGFGNYLVVRRLNANGTPDATFSNTLQFPVIGSGVSEGNPVEIRALAVQSDGKILAGGYATLTSGGAVRFALYRFLADGSSYDTSFGNTGKVITPIPGRINALVQLSDGRIIVAGDNAAARFSASGVQDTTFTNVGTTGIGYIQVPLSIRALAVQSDGKTVVAGDAGGDFAVARFNTSGTNDATFGANGLATADFGGVDTANALALQSGNRIILGGTTSAANNSQNSRFAFARFTATGALDATFGAAGKFVNSLGTPFSGASDIALTVDDKIIAAGFSGDNSNFNFTVARFLTGALIGGAAEFDFDGDGRADASVFRPLNSNWYLQNSTAGFYGVQFGLANDKLAPADYDGDGKTDIAVWRENSGNPDLSYFYILQSSNNAFRVEQFGRSGDDPRFVGDWDGDGKADPAVYRAANNTFYYRPSATPASFVGINWGTSGDVPVRGDFDGDGKLDAAVFRGGDWLIRQSSNGNLRAENWGLSTDKFVPADYDGDGKTDLAVFRNGVWYIKQSSNNQFMFVNWGLNFDALVPADYDGDGRVDTAVWRSGVYYIRNTANGAITYQYFGTAGDKPVAAAFVQ